MLQEVELILLDLDDTLWDTWSNNKESLKELYTALVWEQYFCSFDSFFENYYYPINHKLWERYNREEISKEELSLARLREPFELRARETGMYIASQDPSYWMDCDQQLLSLIRQKTKLCPGALDLVRYLHTKYRICILSNGFGEVQYDKLHNSGLSPYIDTVVLSDEVGYNKPNPKLFEHALSLMGASNDQTVMIGDSWASDIIGASLSGISSIWYNRYELPYPKHHQGVRLPFATVTHLQEITALL